jgi:putative ABC transport system permease protein
MTALDPAVRGPAREPEPVVAAPTGARALRRVLGVAAAVLVVGALGALAGATGAAIGAAVLCGALLAPVAHDWVSQPTFRRLALRNANRRKGEAALVVIGSLLGTAIITASMVVGDTITASLSDIARTRLGPVDEVVEVLDPALLDDVEAALATDVPEGIDGTMSVLAAPAAAANDDADHPRAAPAASLLELDFDAARGFGDDPGITGFEDAGPTPSGDEAVINERLAARLDLGVGDVIRVFSYGYAVPLRVRDVVPEMGVAGYAAETSGAGLDTGTAAPIFVAPGTLDPLFGSSLVPGARPPAGQVLVSNEGGVFDSLDAGRSVAEELRIAVAEVEEAEVKPAKADLIEGAEEAGASLQELYSGIGAFSVIAGILLLVNLFVMLADERKVQLGMLRALGFRRNHLCRTFGIEGAAYAVAAAALGALAGVGVGWVVNEVASGIFNGDDVGGVAWNLDVELSSLVAGGLAGLAISLLTIWATSVRIARLNVISAIRDLPEPRKARQGVLGIVLGAAGMVLGALIFAAGYRADDAVGVMAGVPIAAFCAIPLLRRLLSRKVVVVSLSLVSLVWTVAVFSLFPEAMTTSEIGVFVVMGVLLVTSAVAITSQIDHLWVAVNDHLTGFGGGLSARLGLAYPLARKFRTGMLLGMYAIVIFTMTFMSSFIQMFGSQAPTFTEDIAAGYDLMVESNPGNPLTVAQLLEQPEVEAVAPLLYSFPDFEIPDEEGSFPLTGFDESLLAQGSIGLASRSTRYGSDAEVLEAVLADDSLVVVDDFFLQDGGGPPEQLAGVGDGITVINRATGERRDLEVVGVLDSDFVFHGVLAGRPFVQDLLGPQSAEFRHYVKVVPGADPDEVAATLTGRLVGNGADANTFAHEVEKRLAQQQSFFSLMRGYLGLGLLIGIAGLGVVMIRAVRERRREIGMLRAMGFGAGVVRRAFLVEAAFIAIQGALIGIGLGLLTSYEVVVNSSTFGDQSLPFQVPWLAVSMILIVPLVASLLAAAAPATQAARIKPAVALRIAD